MANEWAVFSGTPHGVCPRCHCCPEQCVSCDACAGAGGECCLGLGRYVRCLAGCDEHGVHRRESDTSVLLATYSGPEPAYSFEGPASGPDEQEPADAR